MLVCITGASGFIGNKLLNHHIALGHQVRYLTRSATTQIPSAKAFIGSITGSVDVLISFLEGADIFYHCAGEINDEKLMRETHIQGTKNLLLAVESILPNQKNAIHWIHLSSCGAYGHKNTEKTKIRRITEGTTEEPTGEYEVTKAESDRLLKNHSISHSHFCYTIIRPSTVFGNGMRSVALKQLARVIKKGLFFYVKNKQAIANYIHIDDVVGAMTLCSHNHAAYNQTFIISNDCKYETMINAIASGLSAKQPNFIMNEFFLRKVLWLISIFRRPPLSQPQIDVMIRKTEYSNEKIHKQIGWSPSASISKQFETYIKEELSLS